MGAETIKGKALEKESPSESLQRAWSLDVLIETQGYWFQGLTSTTAREYLSAISATNRVVTAAMGTRYDVFI